MINIQDNTKVKVDGHVLITDVDSGTVLLDKHNDINYQNIALAMANTLTTKSDTSGRPFAIKRMVFGNGGTSVDNDGNVVYNAVNVAGSTDTLYNRSYHKVLDDTTVFINELPIGFSTENYKKFLESLLYDKNNESEKQKQCLVDFTNHSTEKIVKILLKFKKEILKDLILNDKFENTFKLNSSKYTNYSNMHLYNNKESISKYDSSDEILKEFYHLRLIYYVKRKEHLLKVLKKELDIFESKIRFIEGFIDGSIDILKKEDEEIDKILEDKNFPKFSYDDNENNFSYDYLLNMRIKTLTKTKIDELKNQHENKEAIYKDIDSKDPKELWKDDLNNFLEIYKKDLNKYNNIIKEQIDFEINKKEKKKKSSKK